MSDTATLPPQTTEPPPTTPPPDAPATPPVPEPADIHAQLTLAQGELAESRRIVAAMKRERSIHRELTTAGAIDLDAVGALVNQRVGDAPNDTDLDTTITTAVRDIRKSKPHLFKPDAPRVPARQSQSAMSGNLPPTDANTDLTHAAQRAATTGDRNALLHYLRLRRVSA